jgi:ATP-dependent helicase/nuclease subunit A
LTRAAERLVVAGVMPSRGLPDDSWFARTTAAMTALGAGDPEGEGTLVWTGAVAPRAVPQRRPKRALAPLALPDWLRSPAPVESRPPRPLAPSQIAEDREPAPPPGPELRSAARRGVLLHALFERLPPVAPAERHSAALSWLHRSAGVEDAGVREEIAGAALALIEHPEFADLWTSDALAEAPIAATLPDGRVIAGTVDRLLVTADRVRVVDFKTGRQVPADWSQVPRGHAAQMEAYRDALGVIFPGRAIELALLYSAGPKLISLPG